MAFTRIPRPVVAAALILLSAGTAGSQIVINEVVYNDYGSDTKTWLELRGPGGSPLDGLELVGINGNGGAEYATIDLSGQIIPADGYFVIAEDATLPEADMIDPEIDFRNGPDSILLREVDSGTVLDALGYGNFGPEHFFAGEGDPAPANGRRFPWDAAPTETTRATTPPISPSSTRPRPARPTTTTASMRRSGGRAALKIAPVSSCRRTTAGLMAATGTEKGRCAIRFRAPVPPAHVVCPTGHAGKASSPIASNPAVSTGGATRYAFRTPALSRPAPAACLTAPA